MNLFSNGPPSKGQPCAKVDNEHSHLESVECGKLFPRPLVDPGSEEVQEDPRRRELYRLWLGRNCHFINNFVPLVALALLSNMDFQAITTKFAVIEYMTKYMTKTGQGNMVHVMEHSFSACIEKARELEKGVGSATLKWFNLQSIAEAKSQLETMHLAFELPRCLSTRSFTRLSTRTEMKRVKAIADFAATATLDDSVTLKSPAELYLARHIWKLPEEACLLERHPLTGEQLWHMIYKINGEPVPDSYQREELAARWSSFKDRLSWWEYTRFFKKYGGSIRLRVYADVVFVSPYPRFTKAKDDREWFKSTRDALLAYCNHGPFSKTFADVQALDAMPEEELEELMRDFVNMEAHERQERGICNCPPFIKRAWRAGHARRMRQHEQKRPLQQVEAALLKTHPIKFVFEEESAHEDHWKMKTFEDMTDEDKEAAKTAWAAAEEAGQDEASVPDNADYQEAQQLVRQFMQRELKWSQKELHDAMVTAGLASPANPSLLQYFHLLHKQFSKVAHAHMPRAAQSHKKSRYVAILKILSRTGAKLGGIKGNKAVLADRLAYWLNVVLERGRQRGGNEGAEDSEEELCAPPVRKQVLLSRTCTPGEMPQDAIVDPVQAESALGHVQANELDEEDLDDDAALRAEEEALLGHHVNPPSPKYPCLAVEPNSAMSENFGWHPPLLPRTLERRDFVCTKAGIQEKLEMAIAAIQRKFNDETMGAEAAEQLEEDIASLDPTQRVAFNVIREWADAKAKWNAQPLAGARPPPLRMLLLGTAGTGKTHAAKTAVKAARRILGEFTAVKSVAHTGVAAANLGGGATTIDSVFQGGGDNAEEDLDGELLDRLVAEFADTELLLIDEISMVGAAQFELMSRRLEQVGKVLWWKRFGKAPPDDLGGFGGIAVVCMGDFAQLPPIKATSLLRTSRIEEPTHSDKRKRALQGQERFQSFTQVIRLRRIHRQKGADEYKESTMRLRDAAITQTDYELWQKHALPTVDALPSWEGGEDLQKNGLVLVAEHVIGGRVNGMRLRDRTKPIKEPVPQNPENIVVRCDVVHNDERGARRPAEQYRQLRRAVHLCVGARVMLTQNHIWDMPVVQLGLMNGARGRVVAIVYARDGETRTDGNTLAGVGVPAPGRTKKSSANPLPDFVVVDFPDYTGPALFKDLPRTWVPIPVVEIKNKQTKRYVRVGLPLQLSWALTIHKSQGLSLKEGVIVTLETKSSKWSPVKQPGLAFVGWTRVTSWARMAFCALPPLVDFYSVRLTPGFRQRESFEAWADVAHDNFMKERGFHANQEVQAHLQHYRDHLQVKEQRLPTPAEEADIRNMLELRGVSQLPESVQRDAQRRFGTTSTLPMSQVITALRGQRGSALGSAGFGGKKRRGASAPTANCEASSDPSPWQGAAKACEAILLEHGYAKDHIEEAVATCGSDIHCCIEFCVARSNGAPLPARTSEANLQDSHRDLILAMGFEEKLITSALEETSFDFRKALVLLLAGIDDRAPRRRCELHKARLQRLFKRTYMTHKEEKKRAQHRTNRPDYYTTRARNELGVRLLACDCGMEAGLTRNACFWLSLAAAWSFIEFSAPLSALEEATRDDRTRVQKLLSRRGKISEASIRERATNRHQKDDCLGKLAAKLRCHFCGQGSSEEPCVMMRGTVIQQFFPAYAALTSGLSHKASAADVLSRSASQLMDAYKGWVRRVADVEFADELIVAAVAAELRIKITAIPYTPPDSACDWKITQYGIEHRGHIYLGNDDLHYMWLAEA